MRSPLVGLVLLIGALVASPRAADAQSGVPPLLPQPRSVKPIACGAPFPLTQPLRFPANVDPGAFELLRERWSALGIPSPVIATRPDVRLTHTLPLGASTKRPQARGGPWSQYRLRVDAGVMVDGVDLSGAPRALGANEGEFDALMTLAQLPVRSGGRWVLPCVDIADEAAMPWRIVSDDVSRGPFPTIAYAKRRIRELAALKINGWSPYMEQVVADRRYPFVAWPNAWTPAQLHDLSAYASRFHVELIPEQQTFAHMHETLKWEQLAPLAELPHGYLMAESDPRTYAYLEPLVKSELAATTPDLFHIGSDEPIDLGRGRTPRTPQAFADHVKRVAGFLAGTNARPIIWDDAIQQDHAILGLLPKDLTIATFHYGVEKTYRPYIDTVANAGFEQLVAPGAANWNEIYPDLRTSYANVARFLGEAKGSQGVVGMFMTVWHDDGETLYEATWPSVAYAAATAWQAKPVDDATWHGTFARVFFGTDDPRYAADLDALEAIRPLLTTAPSDPPDYLFWRDPFDPRVQARAQTMDLAGIRTRAEAVLTDLWSARPPLNTGAVNVMKLGALRYDALARRLQIGKEARDDYDDARAHATAPNASQVYRSLGIAKYLCWELRDALAGHRAALRRGMASREHGARTRAGAAALPRRRGRCAALRRSHRRRDARGLPAQERRPAVGRGDVIGALSGIAIVAVFLLLAGLMIARKLPALLAVPLMALATAALAGVHDLASVVTLGAVKLAPVYATLFFGALLSRVVLSTGIAETLVTYAAEFGGDRPLVLSLLMCAVVAVLFTTVTGLGAIIMIGTIVLPVLMTVGVPRATSATLFLLAFGLGYILNIAQWKFYGTVFGVDRTAFQGYAFAIFAVQAIVLVAYAIVRARATRGYATKVVTAPDADAPRKRAGALALVTPVLPLVLLRGFGVDAIVGFAIAAIYGSLVTRPRDVVKTLVAAWIRGIEDVAPATILMIGIGMLLVAANLPEVQAAVKPLVAAVAPRTPVAYVILFGLLSPLALYRGPLNPYGVGIGVYTVLATLHVVPAAALVAAVMAVVQVQNVCDPTNTQNVWVANFTGTGVERITRLLLPWQVGVATVAALLVVVAGGALLGTPPFPAHPASAAETGATGLYAPPAAARAIAVLDDGTPDGAVAAREVGEAVARGWSGFRVVPAAGDPAATDCRAKTYAAAMKLTVTPEGTDGKDVGLELVDCAGWSVDQWHTRGPVRKAAEDVLLRVRAWALEHPALAAEVFERGLASDPTAETPTYFYVLFKPSDGYMRVLVRPGGPAYVAGLRTGDVVDKLDGRFWWEYGTFQTQLRAYDGKPHSFDVERGHVGGPPEHIELGTPFTG